MEVVTGARDLSQPEAADRLVAAGLDRFGRLDAAVAFSGMIVIGRFLESSVEDLHTVVQGCLEAPYRFLRAVVPAMVERGEGQVLVITSASGCARRPARRSTRPLGRGRTCW